MQSLKADHGAESVLFHEGSGNYGQTGKSFKRLASLFGATQSAWGIDTNVGRGFNRVTGVGAFLPPTNEAEDWENANTIIVWGRISSPVSSRWTPRRSSMRSRTGRNSS